MFLGISINVSGPGPRTRSGSFTISGLVQGLRPRCALQLAFPAALLAFLAAPARSWMLLDIPGESGHLASS